VFELVTEWMKNLIGLVLCITFFEMLLPKGGIAKYARFVLGLLIIVSLLEPLLSFGGYLASDILMKDLTGTLTSSVNAGMGENIIEQGEKLAVDSFRKRLADHIRGILILTEGIKDASVYILSEKVGSIDNINIVLSLADNSDSEQNQDGNEKQIKVKLEGVKKIEIAVKTQVKKEGEALQSDSVSDLNFASPIIDKVKGLVADVCGISRERVNVSVI
jgi:stage III sporulation protein AF